MRFSKLCLLVGVAINCPITITGSSINDIVAGYVSEAQDADLSDGEATPDVASDSLDLEESEDELPSVISSSEDNSEELYEQEDELPDVSREEENAVQGVLASYEKKEHGHGHGTKGKPGNKHESEEEELGSLEEAVEEMKAKLDVLKAEIEGDDEDSLGSLEDDEEGLSESIETEFDEEIEKLSQAESLLEEKEEALESFEEKNDLSLGEKESLEEPSVSYSFEEAEESLNEEIEKIEESLEEEESLDKVEEAVVDESEEALPSFEGANELSESLEEEGSLDESLNEEIEEIEESLEEIEESLEEEESLERDSVESDSFEEVEESLNEAMDEVDEALADEPEESLASFEGDSELSDESLEEEEGSLDAALDGMGQFFEKKGKDDEPHDLKKVESSLSEANEKMKAINDLLVENVDNVEDDDDDDTNSIEEGDDDGQEGYVEPSQRSGVKVDVSDLVAAPDDDHDELSSPHCRFYREDVTYTWDAHRYEANERGCDLATVRNEHEQDIVEGLLAGASSDLYLGGYYIGDSSEGVWTWADTWPTMNYVNWKDTTGPDSAQIGNNVYMAILRSATDPDENGKWVNVDGESELGAIYICCE